MKAPVIVSLLVVAVVAFFGGRATRDEQHDIDGQHISFLQDQITAYKDRLQGASPDEAAKKFSTLESALETANRKIDRFMPDKKRHLTDNDKNFIKSHAQELKNITARQYTSAPLPFIIYDMVLGDSLSYASDFSNEFKANGINVSNPMSATCDDGEDGVLVGMKDPLKPPVNASKFLALLTEIGCAPHTYAMVQCR